MTPSDRVHFFEAQGRPVLLLDCRHASPAEFRRNFDDYDSVMRAQAPDSTLVLAHCADVSFDGATLNLWSGASKEHFSHVRRAAYVGLGGMAKLAFGSYRLYCRMAGVDIEKKIRSFDREEAALAWLLGA